MAWAHFSIWLTAALLLALIVGDTAEARRGSKRNRESDDNVEDDGNEVENHRQDRAFSIFELVRFPNDACVASGGMNGTCYTAQQCEDRGGSSGGTCASGFGTCCVFSIGCGQTSAENCTFFTENSVGNGACSAEICPCNDNICQLRLDFTSFVINGPSTVTVSQFKTLFGNPAAVPVGNAKSSNLASNCLTDTFQVTSPGNNAPPVICGTNTGQHMYVDAVDTCNDLVFNFGNGGASAARNFNIKVTQISCNSELLAPDGCTQYFTGNTGIVETFNFNNGMGQHLANQQQNICFRRERGQCRVCVAAISTADFMVSGTTGLTKAIGKQTQCCQYGSMGTKTGGFDCVVVPSASNKVGVAKNDRLCGRQEIGPDGTRCTSQVPFRISFVTDGFEFAAAISEAAAMDVGFRLGFEMRSDFCDVQP